jgi:hypothetical protein
VKNFGAERLDLFLAQGQRARDVFIPGGILGDESATSNQIAIVGEVFVLAKPVDVAEEYSSGNTDERIFDPVKSRSDVDTRGTPASETRRLPYFASIFEFRLT